MTEGEAWLTWRLVWVALAVVYAAGVEVGRVLR